MIDPLLPALRRWAYGRSPRSSVEKKMSGFRRDRPHSAGSSASSSLPSGVARADILHQTLRARSQELRHDPAMLRNACSAPLATKS